MRRNILVDIDHVLSNAFWRDNMIGAVSWDEYHLAGKEDKPIDDMVKLINALGFVNNGPYAVIAMTARPEKFRKQTMEWLIKNDVCVDELLMRPDDSFRPAPEIKLELARKRFPKPEEEIAIVFDDRLDVVSAFSQLGITAVMVRARSK